MREVITGFAGAIPRATEFGLPANVAVHATNAKLVSGEVRGIHALTLLHDFLDTNVGFAFKIPDPPGADVWMKFVSKDAVVIHSPVVNDAFDRYYWHEPGQPIRYNTLARIKAGDPAYLLGIPKPVLKPVVTVAGGSGDSVERSYTYTFVSAFGEEGPPADPSDIVTGFDNGTWTVANMDTSVPDAAERNITEKKIYRTITSVTNTADFFYVDTIPLAQATYDDVKPDLDVATLGVILQSTFWFPPPADLEGIISFPGGVILGWKGDTVFMSVPYRPHAWPDFYQVMVEQPIIGLGVAGNTVVCATQGVPFAITMTTPDGAALEKIQAPEPCLSRGSIVGAPEGVFYASQNGLMMFGSGGFINASRGLITKEEWLGQFNPTTLRAARYQTEFIGITAPGTGYVISAENGVMTLVELTELSGADNIFNDVWTGEVFLLSAGRVFKWDDALTAEVLWRWASKRFYVPYEINVGAVRIGTKKHYYNGFPARPDAEPMAIINLDGTGSDGASVGVIPNIPVWAPFELRVYADGKLIFTRRVISPDTIKLPSGIKSQDWQFEILGRVPMAKFEWAETAKELSGV